MTSAIIINQMWLLVLETLLIYEKMYTTTGGDVSLEKSLLPNLIT